MYRLVLAEGHRFPELAETFYQQAVGRTGEAVAAWLRRQSDRGLITLDDERLAAEMLRGMMIMEPQRALILGQRGMPSPQEIVDRAKLCARLFLDGSRTR